MIRLKDYDCYLRVLNQHQLVFERLKKSAPLLDDKLPHIKSPDADGQYPDSLETAYGEVESFLNDIVDEYQRCRHLVSESGEIGLDDLVAASRGPVDEVSIKNNPRKRTRRDFIYDTQVFKRKASIPVDVVVRRLEYALLEAPDLRRTSVTDVG